MEKVMESRGTRSIRYRETKRERRLARGERRRGQTWEERGGGGGRGEEPTAEEGRQHEAAPALLEICEMGEHKGQTKEVRPRKFRSPVAVHGKSQKNPPAAEGDLYQLTFPRPRQTPPPHPTPAKPRHQPVTTNNNAVSTPSGPARRVSKREGYISFPSTARRRLEQAALEPPSCSFLWPFPKIGTGNPLRTQRSNNKGLIRAPRGTKRVATRSGNRRPLTPPKLSLSRCRSHKCPPKKGVVASWGLLTISFSAELSGLLGP